MMTKCKENKFSIIFLLFLFCYFGFYISKVYGFAILPDEFGYWTYAARWQGYDWSEFTSLSSYYSYGYSVFLLPIFALFRNPVLAYRAAVTLNFLLLIADFFMLKYLIVELFVKKDKKMASIFSAIALLYPSWLYYAKTTMIEIVLMTFYLLIVVLLYQFIQTEKKVYLALLMATTVYIHFLHMRAIGTAIAVIITLVVYAWKNKKQFIKIFFALVFIIALFFVGIAVKEYIQMLTYTDVSESAGKISNNDYAGQFERIRVAFSREKISGLIVSVLAKFLYMSLATYGLAPIGLYFAIREFFRLYRKEKNSLLYLFISLSTLAQIGVASVFLYYPLSIDDLLYGRYHEMVMIVLIPFGLMGLMERRPLLYKLVGVLTGNSLLGFICAWWIKTKQIGTSSKGCMMVGLISYRDMKEISAQQFLLTVCILGSLCFVGIVLIWCVRKRTTKYDLLILVMILEMVLSVRASSFYWDGYSNAAHRDAYVAEMIENLSKTNDRRVVYVKMGATPYIDILCFMMRDTTIEMIERNDLPGKDTIVILDHNNTYVKEIQEQYDCKMTYGHFTVLYNMGGLERND